MNKEDLTPCFSHPSFLGTDTNQEVTGGTAACGVEHLPNQLRTPHHLTSLSSTVQQRKRCDKMIGARSFESRAQSRESGALWSPADSSER
jgi:uncharacterized protein (DUF169 family)